MPDFSSPTYEPYVALMRELRLERGRVVDLAVEGWQDGDWCVSPNGSVDMYSTASESEWTTRAYNAFKAALWVPSLADWLDMLEEAGCTYVELWQAGTRNGRPMYVCSGARDGEEPPSEHARSAGRHPTREEAAARLWIAITTR